MRVNKFQVRLQDSPSNSTYQVYFYTVIATSSASIIAHGIGLLAIHFYQKKVNQNLILASLSTAEIFASFYRIVYEAIVHAIITQRLEYMPIMDLILPSIFYIPVFAIVLSMLALTMDRMILILCPLRL